MIISRIIKNMSILVGESCVEKTAISEGFAQKIIEGSVPPSLVNKRLMALDMGSLVAGTKYRGEFEERMKKIIDEIYEDGEVVLFIDELHTLIGAGGAEGAIDASNILKPALARGELQTIGATTLDEYQKYIEKDAALERRFASVRIDSPSQDETIAILQGLKDRYEKHHNVHMTDEALKAAVVFSSRYIQSRELPDKAIDLMDESAAKVRLDVSDEPTPHQDEMDKLTQLIQDKEKAISNQNFEQAAQIRQQEIEQAEKIEELMNNGDFERPSVYADDIAEVVAQWTGIPVHEMKETESDRLLHMEDSLHERVIGQNDAVNAIARAVRRARSGIKDPNRPIGSFMFLGPTGVGKTELAKAVAEVMFGSEEDLIRIDMSEYMEKYTTSRLVGSPPGYVGYDEGGQLTEKIRQKPNSVILLDEIEKAHPDVFNILLQVLDDGVLTDGKGRKVDFKNTIIIMTSNIGVRQLKDFGMGVGFATKSRMESSQDHSKSVIQNALKRTFSPEFLNRIDDIVIFNTLEKEHIFKIIDITLNDLYQRLKEMNYSIELTPRAKDFVANKGYDPQFGARPLQRAIQKYIEDPLAEFILRESPEEGSVFEVDYDDTIEDNEEVMVGLKTNVES